MYFIILVLNRDVSTERHGGFITNVVQVLLIINCWYVARQLNRDDKRGPHALENYDNNLNIIIIIVIVAVFFFFFLISGLTSFVVSFRVLSNGVGGMRRISVSFYDDAGRNKIDAIEFRRLSGRKTPPR